MILEVIKLIPFKKSRNEGDVYLRIEMINKDTKCFYKTDIVPGFRNYRRWKKVARIGNVLGNLELKDALTIDADSYPILMNGRRVLKETEEDHLKNLAQSGVFG